MFSLLAAAAGACFVSLRVSESTRGVLGLLATIGSAIVAAAVVAIIFAFLASWLDGGAYGGASLVFGAIAAATWGTILGTPIGIMIGKRRLRAKNEALEQLSRMKNFPRPN